MAAHSSILAWGVPMDRGAWGTTFYRVSQSETWLKQLITRSFSDLRLHITHLGYFSNLSLSNLHGYHVCTRSRAGKSFAADIGFSQYITALKAKSLELSYGGMYVDKIHEEFMTSPSGEISVYTSKLWKLYTIQKIVTYMLMSSGRDWSSYCGT